MYAIEQTNCWHLFFSASSTIPVCGLSCVLAFRKLGKVVAPSIRLYFAVTLLIKESWMSQVDF
jgi:hypothetical protein